MMRYSFNDFLNYQNEINKKCDEQEVNYIIDNILKHLRKVIENHPTTRIAIIRYYWHPDSDKCFCLEHRSAAELSKVKKYFEDMGFKVSYTYNNDSPIYPVEALQFEW